MSMLDDVADSGRDRLLDRIGLGVLTHVVPRDLIDEVLDETATRERRVRLLPARLVVYYVLALTLFYGDAYEEVMRKLVNGLRPLRLWSDEWTIPSTGAISRARARLGPQPLRRLFDRVAVPLAESGTPGAWYRGLRVMAIDGVILDAADTPDNVERFEKKEHLGGASAFPQIRVVGLAECGTHAVVAAALDGWRTYERALAEQLLGAVGPGMLVLADRGFFSYDLWRKAAATDAALVWRVSATLGLPVLEDLADGSYLSEVLPKQLRADLNRGQKRRVPDDVRVQIRVVEYSIGDRGTGDVIRLVTTLTDHHQYPAIELAALYAQRWEFELSLDEIETHQLAGGRVLRSKKPELVEQEIWALLLSHYAIRRLMHHAADDLNIDEDRLSFVRSLRVARRSIVSGPDFPPDSEDNSH